MANFAGIEDLKFVFGAPCVLVGTDDNGDSLVQMLNRETFEPKLNGDRVIPCSLIADSCQSFRNEFQVDKTGMVM